MAAPQSILYCYEDFNAIMDCEDDNESHSVLSELPLQYESGMLLSEEKLEEEEEELESGVRLSDLFPQEEGSIKGNHRFILCFRMCNMQRHL